MHMMNALNRMPWIMLSCRYLFQALSIESVVDDELALQNVMIAQAEGTEAVSDPAQALASEMRVAGVRVRGSNDLRQ